MRQEVDEEEVAEEKNEVEYVERRRGGSRRRSGAATAMARVGKGEKAESGERAVGV